MNIIFGPIRSNRFGKSLGIDLSPSKKQCNYDCIYCELEPAKTIAKYSDILSVEVVVDALKNALKKHQNIDVLTITANGEPTLYPHLPQLIQNINRLKGSIKTLILTNASTISDPNIQEILLQIDIVKFSLDCGTQKCLKRIDRIHENIDIENIKRGMLKFSKIHTNSIIVEILIVDGVNDKESEMIALNEFLIQLQPDRIDLGTIDRPPAYDVKAVSYNRLKELSMLFDPLLYVSITQKKDIKPYLSSYSKYEIITTLSKRPLTPDDINLLFDENSKSTLHQLLKDGEITTVDINGVIFYKISSKNKKTH